MNSNLQLDWASYKSARYAVENWHYSGVMPAGKLVKIGAWEDKRFIGVVIFGLGATAELVKSYGLNKQQGCELVRIALRGHDCSVTRIVSIALKMLAKSNPGLRLVVSFADPDQGHHGGIYQGGNWIYTGTSTPADEYFFAGKKWHGRSFRSRFGNGAEKNEAVTTIKGSAKHRYLMPLDNEMRNKIKPLAKPYPKRAKQAMAGPPAQRRGSTDRHAPAA